jgi:hypothetical protein
VADDDSAVDTSGESPVMLTPVNPAPTGRR